MDRHNTHFNPREDDPADFIYGFFEDLATVHGMVVGVSTLEELYNDAGAPRRPADKYLWDLGDKLGSTSNSKFSENDLDQLKQQNKIIQDPKSRYPQYLKDAISELLRRVSARSEGRNISSGKTAGILNTRARNLIGNNRPAMKKALDMTGFQTEVGSFLTSANRIKKESKGTVDPALRNLKLIAQGQVPEPLRPYGTGTGGRRKTKSVKKVKKTKKSKAKTRRV
jgi:hypothetical protein